MSVAGRSVKDTSPIDIAQPVIIVGSNGANATNADGSQDISGVNGTSVATAANPFPTSTAGLSGTAISSLANPFPVASIDGTTVSRVLSAAASTNATSAKASAGVVEYISGFNANAAARYLKLYNKASAPTVGTDTPVFTEYLAPQSKFSIPLSLYFATGIAYALTTGAADNDTGALTAADILAMNVVYR